VALHLERDLTPEELDLPALPLQGDELRGEVGDDRRQLRTRLRGRAGCDRLRGRDDARLRLGVDLSPPGS